MRHLPVLAVLCTLTSGALAAPDDSAFFGALPAGSKAVIELCAQSGQCSGLNDLNQGYQLFTLKVWEREIARSFPVEVKGERLTTAARKLERLLAPYYLWPAGLPRSGRIELHSLPGVAVSRTDFTISFKIEKAFAPETTIGGARTVRPQDFTTPGTGLFGLFNASARSDEHDVGFGFDADLSAQWHLWQLHTRSSFEPDGTFNLDHAYAERPLLESAMRLRAGLMYSDGLCSICVSSKMLGASLTSDSLGGLLYANGNSASFDVEIDGNIDEIEIFRSGTRVRRERAIPGYHTVVVDHLENGTNLIEIYGIDRQGGQRRLLAAGERVAASNVLEASRVEYDVQAGWAVYRDSPDVSFDELDFDDPFLQVSRRQGLEGGREIGTSVFVSPDALLAEQSLQLVFDDGQMELAGIGSLAEEGVGGGGRAEIRRSFGKLNLGFGATLCGGCYDSSAGRFEPGLQGDVQAYLSTRSFGWAISAALDYDVLEPEDSSWRINLARTLLGGRFNFYARDFFQHDDGPDHRDIEVGFRFTKTFGGERLRAIETGVDYTSGAAESYVVYRDRPRRADGVFGEIRLSGDAAALDEAANLDLQGGIGYQNAALRGSIDATRAGSGTVIDANVSSGFAWIDGQLAFTRKAYAGGFLASGLTPNSPVFVNSKDVARADLLGQVHIQTSTRGSPAKVTMYDSMSEGSQSVTREREALPLPRFLYGVGERFRRQERTYRLVIDRSRQPVSPGVSLYDADGEEIGITGYDGVVTITGVAGTFEFEENGEICTGAFTGEENGQDLPVLSATCQPVRPGE